MRYNSSYNMLGMIAELNYRRMGTVLGQKAQRTDGHLSLTAKQVELLQTCRRIHLRYLDGENRHEENEEGQIRELMQWLINEHAWSRGREPTAAATFPSQDMRCRSELPRGTYWQLKEAMEL